MAARDLFHALVRAALETHGWTITHDPYVLTVGGVDFAIDLGAEHLMAAKRDGVQIAVEIKSFLGPSLVTDFHAALGQFLNYQLALEQTDPTRQLYLAVPLDAYLTFFQLPFAQTARDRYAVRLLIYDPGQPEVLTWTPHPPIG